ncbi:hypothetical protein LOTGIDRAFT_111664 [Lottia gigantea]|uniref:Major facilitator superfamily (MFS) profile domain-containing protein n=1 Tax=Lottia gigantea TaxID=225164 RepID=V4AVR1_LOTGI|nr:hypothetical protein LOTGIDRAFT_111664 [Lottia gigantea]ESP01443.1 hypothetical protein LOTGIDRAFT_111664 [Lottia gigantea]
MEGGVWGLVIILSAFMIQFIAFGISGSIGVYNVEFLDDFETDALEVSLISSINLGVFLGTGPLASYLMDRFSHRKVVIFGGLMCSMGILAIPWLPSINYLYFVYGVVNGLGGCLAYVPSHVLSGLYYDKKRGLATGIATAGSGLGITVGPIVIAYLIEEYTWRGSLIILTGVSLNIMVFGALLRPVPMKAKTKIISKSEVPSISSNLETVVPLPNTDDRKMPYLKKLVKYILTDIDFLVYFVNNIFWNMGLGIILALLAEFCVEKGISKIDSAFIVTLNGLGSFVGCLTGGVLSNIKRLNSYYTFALVNVLAGVSLLLMPIFSGIHLYITLSILCGFFIGIILGYLLALLADILGPELFGDGVGVIMIANGLGAFLGPSIAGKKFYFF